MNFKRGLKKKEKKSSC